MINLLGGSISVDSVERKGSVFTFDIPYLPVNSKKIILKANKKIDNQIFRGKKYWLLKMIMLTDYSLKKHLKICH